MIDQQSSTDSVDKYNEKNRRKMPKLYSCFTANNDNRKKQKQNNKEINLKSKKAEKTYAYKLLLSGDNASGKTAIIEKMTALRDPFTQQEKIDKIPDIKRYIRDSLSDILRAFEQTIPSIQLEQSENQWRATYILTTAHEIDFNYPPEFFEHVAILWIDKGVQLCMSRSVERKCMDAAKYFLDRVNIVRYPTYIPSTIDMVYCRLFTSNAFKLFFKHERVGFHLFEMDLRCEEQQEWVEYFCDIVGIIFVTDCSCFDSMTDEDKSQNRLQQSIELFKTIRKNEWLRKKSVILLLNKQDLLAKKIKNGVRLEDSFPDFSCYVKPRVQIGVKSEPDNFETDEDRKVSQAKHFICDQFLRASMSTDTKYYSCYPHFTCDADISVSLIVDDCRSIIVQMHLRQFELL